MIITYVKEPLPYIVIDKTFTPDELKLIYRELEFIQPKLLEASETASALDKNGEYKKQNKGVFLDEIYNRRIFSDILTVNRKFFTKDNINAYPKCHPAYASIYTLTKDSTLISYYETSDHYKSHSDSSVISICTWFFKEPKNFTGGDFIFSDYDITIPVRNNMSIVFLGCYPHEVSKINLLDPSVNCSGRFTMSIFLTHR